MTNSAAVLPTFLRPFDFNRLHVVTRPSVVVIDVDSLRAPEHIRAHGVTREVQMPAISREQLQVSTVLGRDLLPLAGRFP